jgi:hypothetical protein
MLKKDPPDVVFTTSTRGSGSEEYVPDEFLQRWADLRATGVRIVAVRDTPWMKFWVPECLEMKGHDSEECTQQTAAVYSAIDPVTRVVDPPEHVRFIDMSEYFCDEEKCSGVIGNVIVYRDDSHITATYARSLAPMLLRKLSGVLPPEWIRPQPQRAIATAHNGT